MPPLLSFARLTVWEISRRRLLIALAALTLILIVATSWGFSKLNDPGLNGGRPLGEAEVRVLASQLLILVAFLFSGVLALSAAFVGAPSLSGDVESNLALALLARPVRRSDYVLGKWLGMAVLVVVYAAGTGLLAVLGVWIATRYVPPNVAGLIVSVAGEGLVVLTLSLLLSTRVPGMTGGIVALVLWFMAWIGGIAGGIGQALENSALITAGVVMGLVFPTDALWRSAVYSMEPVAVVVGLQEAGRATLAANPFAATEPIPLGMLIWSIVWMLAALALAVVSFRSREI
jgi:ABC-type transport system involved in multi-copper enzyme maturation permease subunit